MRANYHTLQRRLIRIMRFHLEHPAGKGYGKAAQIKEEWEAWAESQMMRWEQEADERWLRISSKLP